MSDDVLRLIQTILGAGKAAPGGTQPIVGRPARHGSKSRIGGGGPERDEATCPECGKPLHRKSGDMNGKTIRTSRFYDKTTNRVICTICAEGVRA